MGRGGLFAVAAAVALVGCARPSAGAPEHTNRLAKETSPYLLQHAHNPVDWYPWGPEAFEKAKKEDRPIFLSIGYSSCHWCHVMERESFENPEIAKQLNERFVCIKVDREERPDVDEIYMTAVQAMNEGRGGWPLSVFLTPDAKPFYGGTYYKPDAFTELLRAVFETWSSPSKRKQLEEQAAKMAVALARAGTDTREPGKLSPAGLETGTRSYLEMLDDKNGGFGGPPKFPPAVRLLVMLEQYRKKADPKLLSAVTLTLDHMARGGMWDQVGGGFHRYSTDAKWLVPHFEKMLYDNALLAQAYFEAYRTTQNPYYRRIGAQTLDFLLREMRDPEGGFWSSLDADSRNAAGEREEGLFYVWTPAEIKVVLGPADAAVFNKRFGVTAEGNWEGKNIPNLLAAAAQASEWPRLDALRAKLLAAREKRARPGLDDKVLANWNGLTIQAFAIGYDVTGDTRYREAAEKAAGFILKSMRREGKLVHSYRAGRTQPQSFLEDYAFLIPGLLELHRVTPEERWLTAAESLGRTMVADFWDEPSASFFLTPKGHETLIARLKSPEDGATPSGPAMAALSLIRLGRATGKADFTAHGQRVLETYAMDMKRYPQAIPAMLLAAHTLFSAAPAAQAEGKPEPVKIAVEAPTTRIKAGQDFEVKVKLTIQNGWHVNSDKPDDEFLIPTKVELAPGPFKLVSATYPKPQTVKLGISEKPAKVYTGEAVVTLKVTPEAGAEKAEEIRVKVSYQSCNDKVCLRPMSPTVAAKLKQP
jgi:uncharacterized protein YyaL (SSP411 family)